MKALQIPVTLFIHANVSQYTQEKSPCSPWICLSTRNTCCWKPAKSTSTLTNLNRSTSSGSRLKRCSWKARLADATYKRIAEIDDQVQQLLCIEHCPVDVDELPY